mmetsp:Transcript_12210/g.38670  ORF Transcript_12210/g.38670 Transcript_12210/m.38670 type:complete len:243 (-) Transcript_12210:862-1590(-)
MSSGASRSQLQGRDSFSLSSHTRTSTLVSGGGGSNLSVPMKMNMAFSSMATWARRITSGTSAFGESVRASTGMIRMRRAMQRSRRRGTAWRWMASRSPSESGPEMMYRSSSRYPSSRTSASSFIPSAAGARSLGGSSSVGGCESSSMGMPGRYMLSPRMPMQRSSAYRSRSMSIPGGTLLMNTAHPASTTASLMESYACSLCSLGTGKVVISHPSASRPSHNLSISHHKSLCAPPTRWAVGR